jgi:hypothetical protein
LAHNDVTSQAWQERHTLLRQQLEPPHNSASKGSLHDQFNRRLAQAAAYARKHNRAPERFLDATTALEVRLWQQQQAFAQEQTRHDYQQHVHRRVDEVSRE